MKIRRMPSSKPRWRAGLLPGVAIAVALACTPAHGQARWCAAVEGGNGGFVNCGYATWQQCRAALSGQGGVCHPDPGAGARSPPAAYREEQKRTNKSRR
jgi:hypothetical protein